MRKIEITMEKTMRVAMEFDATEEQIEIGELKRKCSDGTEEPMDWIEVYWNWNEDDEQIIWGSYDD